MWFEGELFHVDPLAVTVGVCITFFAFLTLFYSRGYTLAAKGRIRYNVYILLTLGTSLGVVLANNLIVLLVGWGLSGALLYLLIGYGSKERTPSTAKKAFIIIGGSDVFMLFGVALIYELSGSLEIQQIRLSLDQSLDQPHVAYAFVCMLIAALAKAGAIPLHTWIPDTAEDAPTPVTAFLPAAVDKLLGSYLLARVCLDLFVMTSTMYTVLLIFGAVTIIGAGMMMLVQQDFKRLLGYCAVSQVGYIILGFGSGHPLGIAGGLFHMVNAAICKSCLFFSGGAVEQRNQTTDVERLGGMARQMPVIFVSFLIAALAISGIPPLNGFASKWLIYQGIIETGKEGGGAWILWLVVAMFGSALTLAGMMQLVHAIFLGQPAGDQNGTGGEGKGTPLAMLIPSTVLALLCVLFGIWAYGFPLRHLILPILEQELVFSGIWQPTLATVLILVGIGFGLILYMAGRLVKTMRQTQVFIGGETLDAVPGMRVSGSEFYDTIQQLPGFRQFYTLAQNRLFDLYQIGTQIILGMHRFLGYLHNGVLSIYLAWCLLGMGILFIILLFG